jgi:hypothetical protein
LHNASFGSGNRHFFLSLGNHRPVAVAATQQPTVDVIVLRDLWTKFRTWAEEQTDTAFEVKEAALGHHVDTAVVGAYERSDRMEKRANLIAHWEKFLFSKRYE